MESAEDQSPFPVTRWTMVLKVRTTEDKPSRRLALGGLCKDYWYPLYVFARRRGHSASDAQDLTQGFFMHLLEKNLFADAEPERGRLRTFLLAAFRRYLERVAVHEEAAKRGGGCEIIPLDLVVGEERYACEPLDLATPEKLFERSWALAVLQVAMKRLGTDETKAGREVEFRVLEPFISMSGAGEGGYLEAAARLGVSEESVRQVVSRLRGRFREILRQQIADTLLDPTSTHVDAELASLRAALRG